MSTGSECGASHTKQQAQHIGGGKRIEPKPKTLGGTVEPKRCYPFGHLFLHSSITRGRFYLQWASRQQAMATGGIPSPPRTREKKRKKRRLKRHWNIGTRTPT